MSVIQVYKNENTYILVGIKNLTAVGRRPEDP